MNSYKSYTTPEALTLRVLDLASRFVSARVVREISVNTRPPVLGKLWETQPKEIQQALDRLGHAVYRLGIKPVRFVVVEEEHHEWKLMKTREEGEERQS